MRPNVLLVVFDTARADAFEPYGARAGASPTVRQLASRGSASPLAIAPASWTLPSHAAMFTGVLPRTLGLGQPPGGIPHNCRPILEKHSGRLLPEVLRRDGYATFGVSGNLWISADSGFDIGFDEFVFVRSKRVQQLKPQGMKRRLKAMLEVLRPRLDDGAADTERALKGWMTARRDQPFFAFANLIECHSPYMPPAPYNSLHLRDRLKAAAEARRHLNLDAIWRACAGGFDVPDDAIARMRELYAGAVRMMDDWLARILQFLDYERLLDDTLVIITSDHGENMGEGRLMGHCFSLDQRLIHVPLVSAGPGHISANGVTSLADLPQMVARGIGLEDHPWHEEHVRKDGVAIAQFDELAAPGDPRADETAERWGLGAEAVRRLTTSITCATDGALKLVRDGDREWLYDLAQDPLEMSPLPRTPDGTEVDRATIARLEKAVADGALGHVAPQPVDVDLGADERADLERRMRFLGYM
jgi:arylsulfatase A-like enzyme